MGVGWSPYRLLAPGGRGGKLNIFIFHRVRPAPDPLFPWDMDAAGFSALLAFLRRWFTVLPLDEAVRRLESDTLPPAAVSVTFDDGYADNLTVARPLLERYEVPATVFVANGYLDGGRMWNDTVIEAVRTSRAVELDLRDEGLSFVALRTAEEKRQAIDALLAQVPPRARTRAAGSARGAASRWGYPTI
jgi:peptidoglycan/xylan/chitin deacetylase (PgdA/CDA1 family)